MPDEVKEATPAPAQPAQSATTQPAQSQTAQPAPAPNPAPKLKPKPEKVKLKLTRAGSCNYEGIILRKSETVELEASRAEQLMQSGLFERL